MAGIPQLKVIIGADGKPLQKTLGDLRGDVASFKKQIESASNPKMIADLNRQLKDTQKNINKLETAGTSAAKSMSNFAIGLAQGLGIGVFQTATAAVSEFFSGAITESLEAQRAVANLHQSLEAVGRGDLFDGLSREADDLAKKFAYLDNDDITGAFTKLIQFGGLTEKQIRDLIPVIIDLNAKQRLAGDANKTVTSSTEDIQKALSGSSRELKKFGIDIDANSTVSQRYALIMGSVAQKVKGAGDAFANSLEGNLARTTQQAKNLQEELGNKLLPMKVTLIDFALSVGKGFEFLYQKISGTYDSVQKAKQSLEELEQLKADAKKGASEIGDVLGKVDEAGFKKILRLYDDQIDRLSKLKDEKQAQSPGDYSVITKQLAQYREIVEALKERRRLELDKRKLGDPPKPPLTEAKTVLDLLTQQYNIKKKLAELYPGELDFLKESQELEIKVAFQQAKDDGATDEQATEIANGIQLKAAQIYDKAQKQLTAFLAAKPLSFNFNFDDLNVANQTLPDGKMEGRNMYQGVIDKAKLDGEFAKKELEKLQNGFNIGDFINDGIVDIGTSLSESLGKALGGEDFNPFEGILSVIADSLSQLGKALIAFGIAEKLAIESLKSFNPYVAIGAGIVAVAAGAALKAQLTKGSDHKVKKFATGGVVNQATQGIIGEAGPEIIMPLDRVPSLINRLSGGGGKDNAYIASVEFAYDKMVLGMRRAEKLQGRLQ